MLSADPPGRLTMGSVQPMIRLVLPARSENVSVVRHAFAGLAEALGMEATKVADVKAVVTEACVNAVVHAYEQDEDGVMEVLAGSSDGTLELVVRDFGHGFRPRLHQESEEPSLRLGLPLIAALADSFELHGNPGGGTEVRIKLEIAADEAGPDVVDARRVADFRGETELSVTDNELASLLVSRVLSAIGSRADLSIDRLSDAILLGDAIASSPESFVDGRVQVSLEDSDRAIVANVGPLKEGAAERFITSLDVPQVGASLRKLADEVEVESAAGGDRLRLRISDARSG
jgi:serine/threonine-protein kinase RsbW